MQSIGTFVHKVTHSWCRSMNKKNHLLPFWWKSLVWPPSISFKSGFLLPLVERFIGCRLALSWRCSAVVVAVPLSIESKTVSKTKNSSVVELAYSTRVQKFSLHRKLWFLRLMAVKGTHTFFWHWMFDHLKLLIQSVLKYDIFTGFQEFYNSNFIWLDIALLTRPF